MQIELLLFEKSSMYLIMRFMNLVQKITPTVEKF